MTDQKLHELTCAEVGEIAGLYVLDALSVDEYEQVRSHLATCPEPHPELAELGSVVPSLASLIEPVDAPAALKARVLAAVAADAASADAASPDGRPFATGSDGAAVAGAAVEGATATTGAEVISFDREAERRGRSRWQSLASWGLAAAAVAVIAVLGAWSIVLQSRASQAEERVALIAQAIQASNDPNAEVARLTGTGVAAGASGFAAFPAEGTGYIVMVGLPEAPEGSTYQAWYIVGDQPTSAGLMTVGSDGYAVLSGVEHLPGTDVIALTVEPAGGVEQPTSAPVVVGEVTA